MLCQPFRDWCATRGILVQHVDVTKFPDGLRGVVALQDIPAGTQTARVPRSALFGLDSAFRTPSFAAACEGLRTRPPDRVLLACYVLSEVADEQSSWRPYLETLPQRYPVLGVTPSSVVDELQV